MDSYTKTGLVNVVDSSSWPHNSNSLADILTEISQEVQRMLRLIKDGEPDSTERFLCLYQSLGESYNDLNQKLLNGLLKFDFKQSSSDRNSVSSFIMNPVADMCSFRSDSSPSLELDMESGAFYSSLKHHPVSPAGRKTSSSEIIMPSFKLIDEVEKNQSSFPLADIFRAELETARRDLEARNRLVGELESKLSESSNKIKSLESELDQCQELVEVSEIEKSKLNEMLSECRTEKAKLQTDNGDDLLLDSLRAELRSRDIQIEQMEEYLNQVCIKDTELVSDEPGTDKSVMEELKTRVEELENQVEQQRNVISEKEEEKREAIRQLCFSLDHYKSRYIELVRSSLPANN